MNQTFRSGLALHTLINDAPVDRLLAFLQVDRDALAEASDIRAELAERYASFDPRHAQRLEDDAARILVLSDKGAWALSRVADKWLEGEQAQAFANQLDPMGKSMWCFMHARNVFDDAESLHYVSRYRGYGKLYAAFEINDPAEFVWSGELRERLAEAVRDRLDLQGNCTISHLTTENGKGEIEHVLIVRHPGPLSSIPEHREDGRKERHYFRPPNEATLIYSPANGMVEVCAESPGVRQGIGTCFAVVGLQQNLSNKPITYKHYDLSRFSSSLRLPEVKLEGFCVDPASVTEVDLRPNHPRRKVSLKVPPEDHIEDVADDLFGSNFFRRRGEIIRVAISVPHVAGGRRKTLNITVSHPNSCNLRSLQDPTERELATLLLKEWRVLTALEPPTKNEERALLPVLLTLYDMREVQVTAAQLQGLRLDATALCKQGFLKPHGRHKALLVEEDDHGPEVLEVDLTDAADSVALTGADGRSCIMPMTLVQQYAIRRDWIEEKIVEHLRPFLRVKTLVRVDDDLMFLGRLALPDQEVPCYLARGLERAATVDRLDYQLRAEQTREPGLVLNAGPDGPSFLGANVVLSLPAFLQASGEDSVLDVAALAAGYKRRKHLAETAEVFELIRHSDAHATLRAPGRDPLDLTGKQIIIFERLLKAHEKDAQPVPRATLMKGLGSRSPQNAFSKEKWETICDIYIEWVGSRKGWRLIP